MSLVSVLAGVIAVIQAARKGLDWLEARLLELKQAKLHADYDQEERAKTLEEKKSAISQLARDHRDILS